VKLAVAEIRHWDAVRRVGYIRRLAGGRDVRFTAAIIENGSEVDVARGQRSLVAVEGGFEAGKPRVTRLVLAPVTNGSMDTFSEAGASMEAPL